MTTTKENQTSKKPFNKGVMFQYFEWNLKPDGSLWRQLWTHAIEIHNLGTTAVWLPPAYKGLNGNKDTGYAVYDMYDLGEFDQKGSVATKYGTKEEYLLAVKAVQDCGMDAYADVVFNHRMGGDETETVEVIEVNNDNRNEKIGEPFTISVRSKLNFPGRQDKYSSFKFRAEHFVAFDYCENTKKSGVFLRTDKEFSGEVSNERGNYDFLMGCDVDQYHPDVRKEELDWGAWVLETTQVHGFRLDAVKHIPSSFFVDWLEKLRTSLKREVFAVGEYWTSSIEEIRSYIAVTKGSMGLFDVPLHYHFFQASKEGRDYDLTKIFDNTIVKEFPVLAVTFVDNHDSQPGQSLESTVQDWFKPLAYALILLRPEGYPCLFYGDYFGSSGDPEGKFPLTCHRKIIDDFIGARKEHCYGELQDYFDHPQCVGWLWPGDEEHTKVLAVVMCTGDSGKKKMSTQKPDTTFRDVTGHWPHPLTTDGNGWVEFLCQPGSVSVWCSV